MLGSCRLHNSCMLPAAISAIIGTLALTAATDAATLTVLYHFTHKSGYYSQSSLIFDKEGNLFGTAGHGGKGGEGTVFELTGGREKTLYSFVGSAASYPVGGLVVDSDRNLYGTTSSGGDTGDGTVFELSPGRKLTILHDFAGGNDGDAPYSSLLLRGKWLYGTTAIGGDGPNCEGGCGTVFRVSGDGKSERVIYAFQGGSDGSVPVAGLIEDKQGDLYGTTTDGGAGSDCDGAACGTVYKLAADGTETVLHAFTGDPDGAQPQGGLVADSLGNLYGTTSSGGENNFGAVYKVTSQGSESILYSFRGDSDGRGPIGSLIIDKTGNLYGTTSSGGGGCKDGIGCGAVFEVTSAGAETVLATLDGRRDPSAPFAGLVSDRQGNLYGTAAYRTGGCFPGGCGGIFEVSP